MLEDFVRGEMAEKELNAFIERRALKANAEQLRVEEDWAESTRVHNERVRRNNRVAWYGHHEHMRELHEGLAREHAEKARALLEEGVRAV